MCAVASGSPTLQRGKRRHTILENTTEFANPAKRLKRVKTDRANVTTESSFGDKGLSLAVDWNDQLTSPPSSSGCLNVHPSAQLSAELPGEFMQAVFAAHEPSMFRDSGSTVPDNSSTQRRLVEQAQTDSRKSARPLHEPLESSETRSSSFPWPGTRGVENTPRAIIAESGVNPSVADPPPSHVYNTAAEANETLELSLQHYWEDGCPKQSTWLRGVTETEDHEWRRSSPRVEIPPPSPPSRTVTATSVAESQRYRRSGRRNTQEQISDPLNSDEIAIGLPRERYVPRPTSRRSKTHVMESIDFSVVPEKAAKAARSKSIAAMHTSSLRADCGPSALPAELINMISTNVEHPALHAKSASESADASFIIQEAIKPAPNSQQPPVAEDHPTISRPAAMSPAKENLRDDNIFVKPPLTLKASQESISMRAPVKPSTASKARRSHTTIFEDHIEFAGGKISPSLNQRQARRKSALQDVRNEAPTRRKRRAVVQDDEDEDNDDELTDSFRQQESQKLTSSKASNKILVIDSDAESESLEITLDPNDDKVGSHAKPTKRGRGRPAKKSAIPAPAEEIAPTKKSRAQAPKSTLMVHSNDEVEEEEEAPRQDVSETPAAVNHEKTTERLPEMEPENGLASGDKSPVRTPASPALADLTPSEKMNTPEAPKPKPGTHSPIKNTSGAPLRVGLSKRSRIQPLLRMMKPLKK